MTDSKIVENSAKAIILDGDRVLLVRYEDSTELGLGTWYSLPGGRQHFGESIEEALVRECAEELGAEVSAERLLFVREYIHSRHELRGKGRDQHKVEFMFLCRLISGLTPGSSLDVDQEETVWVTLDDLPSLQIYPTGLRDLKRLLERPGDSPYWGDSY